MINLTWHKVMQAMLDNRNKKHTVKELAEATELKYRQVKDALSALEHRDLIIIFPTTQEKDWETRTKAQISSSGRELISIFGL